MNIHRRFFATVPFSILFMNPFCIRYCAFPDVADFSSFCLEIQWNCIFFFEDSITVSVDS